MSILVPIAAYLWRDGSVARTPKAACLAKKKPAKKTTKKTAPPAKKSGGGAKSAASKPSKKTTKKVTTKVTKKIVKKAAPKVTKKVTTKKISKKKVVKTTTKKAPSKAPASKKKTSKKPVAKTVKKPAPQKTTKKITKKVTKQVTKKVSKKISKKVVKKTVKKVASKSPAKETVKKAPAKSAPAAKKTSKVVKKAPAKKVEAAKPAQPIRRRTRSSKVKKPLILPDRPLLLGPNGPALKPLIATGSRVKKSKSVLDNVTSRRTKTPMTKTQLESYRMILLHKRAELLGDVRHLEEEALGAPGSVNTKSKHADEQGSESYEQSLSLNLAASDRKLINEIDDALARIDDRTYGLCEITYEPIKKVRLDELPWARHTIQAAREMDRRGGM